MSAAHTVHVALGERSYDIAVGAGLDVAGLIRPLLPRPWTVIVTDRNVAALHLEPLRARLSASGIVSEVIVLEPGEETKSFPVLERLVDRLIELKVERSDAVLALGGGVIGDLVGFAASILRRGTRFIQVPTTLLAQVDSSVGGKTAINSRRGKNLVGAFYQPVLVAADLDLLATLPRRELLAGYAEVVKYGLLGDAAFFAWLERNGDRLTAGDVTLLGEAVAVSCGHKARIVAADERETGERALLNLGHTFGHALEAATGFSQRLLHGESVAIGMVMAFDLSVRLGLCPPDDAERVRRHLARVGLPTGIAAIGNPPLAADELWHHMQQDKKAVQGRLTFVLVRRIGEAFLARDVSREDVVAVLAGAAKAA
jgi:3-dehydroquinate synthase